MTVSRVLVVEDSELFRRFVCSTLGEGAELQVIGEASDGLEAVQKAKELKPDLILLDIGLPRLNGVGGLFDSNQYTLNLRGGLKPQLDHVR